MIDIKVPTVGESISEVTLLKWNKKDGEYVERDEVIAEMESEKATFEVNAEKSGVLKTAAQEGDTLKIGDLLSSIDGKILKDDVLAAMTNPGRVTGGKPLFSREEKKEKMTLLRKTISRRLVEAKNTTAMLTTFNEVDMSRIMDIRTRYKEKFKEIH